MPGAMAWDERMRDFHARHLVDDVIDPADTRDVVIRFLALARSRSAIGRHRLAGWPTKF